MAQIGILTDSTALFPTLNYPGQELVNVISFNIQYGEEIIRDTRDPRVCQRLSTGENGSLPQVISPSVDDFVRAYNELGRRYHSVLVILTSQLLCKAVQNAIQAAEIVKGPFSFHVIDSQTTGAGLGLLVQAAARAALGETDGLHLSRLVRGWLPHLYMACCLPGLRSLVNTGQVDTAQAIVGEMLGMIPFYILEGGRLVPTQKARNGRQMVELLHEFASEFDHVLHIALIQGLPSTEPDLRSLRERISQNFPGVPTSEHTLGASLLTLFGARCLGVVVMEAGNGDS